MSASFPAAYGKVAATGLAVSNPPVPPFSVEAVGEADVYSRHPEMTVRRFALKQGCGISLP
jgi:predicted anti-sigma-YlaC factor YlaD